jgi:hypothetical protein
MAAIFMPFFARMSSMINAKRVYGIYKLRILKMKLSTKESVQLQREKQGTNREKCNAFVSRLEKDLTLPRYKTFNPPPPQKKINSDIKENVVINPIQNETWLNFFQNLWLQKDAALITQHCAHKTRDYISFDKLTAVLQRSKMVAPGEDGVHMELFKYAGKEFTYQFLYFVSNILQGLNRPECWQRPIVIPI